MEAASANAKILQISLMSKPKSEPSYISNISNSLYEFPPFLSAGYYSKLVSAITLEILIIPCFSVSPWSGGRTGCRCEVWPGCCWCCHALALRLQSIPEAGRKLCRKILLQVWVFLMLPHWFPSDLHSQDTLLLPVAAWGCSESCCHLWQSTGAAVRFNSGWCCWWRMSSWVVCSSSAEGDRSWKKKPKMTTKAVFQEKQLSYLQDVMECF